MSEITPAPSNSNLARTPSARVFGGKFPDLAFGRMVKHNLHAQPVIMNALSAYSNARLLELSVTAVLAPVAGDFNLNVYLGWGHCEHSDPDGIGQMAQLPYFRVYSSCGQGLVGEPLVCEFDMSITDKLKPVPLEGGRPCLFARVVGSPDLTEKGPVVELFFRAKINVGGYDIVFA